MNKTPQDRELAELRQKVAYLRVVKKVERTIRRGEELIAVFKALKHPSPENASVRDRFMRSFWRSFKRKPA